MKKALLWASLCLVFAASCSDKEEENTPVPTPPEPAPPVTVDIGKLIVGEWVREVHGMENGKQVHAWEVVSFSSATQATISGYREEYANERLASHSTTDNSNVSCTIADKTVTLKSPSGNISRTLTISSISEVAFEATEGGAQEKYARILNSNAETAMDEQPETPAYQTLLPAGTIITGYSSGNEWVVRTDKATGRLMPVASGQAYVYVETDKGTAAIRVAVKRVFETDYAALMGKTKADVESALGTAYNEKEGGLVYNCLEDSTYSNYYQRNAGNWSRIEIDIDGEGAVKGVALTARDGVWFSAAQMTDALAERFTAYAKASEETKKVFLNAATLKEATQRVTWNTESRTLSFMPNVTDIVIGLETFTPDYEGLLGSVTITGYATENPFVAEVAENGGVKGIDSGTTNIVVHTDRGMLKLPVTVQVYLAKDYEQLLGGGQMKIIDMFGTVPSVDYDDEDYAKMLKFNSLTFPVQQRGVGNWETIKFKMAHDFLGPITEILLTAKENVWFTDAQMIAFLKEKYVLNESKSSGSNTFFVNSAEDDLVTASYVWDSALHTLKISKFTYF